MSKNIAPIPFWRWPLWMATLGAALFVFYGILTPVWMLIRLVAWVTERPFFNPGRGSPEVVSPSSERVAPK